MKKIFNFDHFAHKVDLNGILPVRCYFCTVAGPARSARCFRGIWICSGCYPTPEVRAMIGSSDKNFTEEVR
jgi:ribosomal protein L37AE/L43A